jgi:deoxyribodipyrimidine photo-lyase
MFMRSSAPNAGKQFFPFPMGFIGFFSLENKMDNLVNARRVRIYPGRMEGVGPVLYWMHRTFRARDNWGLVWARQQALRLGAPVAAVFCLTPTFLGATLRQYDFLLRGVEETAGDLRAAGISLIIRSGEPAAEVLRLCDELRPSLVVTDFDPLRIKRQWLANLIEHCPVPVHEVDSRNIVPAWIASDHREFMARTFRPRIHRHLQEFLDPFPQLAPHPFPWTRTVSGPDFSALRASLRVDNNVQPVSWLAPGEAAARTTLETFIDHRLERYGQRNDPNTNVCSDLSPYLHFGMISAQAIVLELRRRNLRGEAVDGFVEELVVRRELSDNFCLYTPEYDQVAGFPEWARRSLARHRHDARPYVYSDEQFDRAQTHDMLWNAAQHQLVATGKMPGYLRMYWAKKILEWTEDPAEALRIAIHLNDRYALDGRETNGYTGIAWSIGGVHDRGWAERPIFGTVRYMNAAGARRKFDVNRYIRTWTPGHPPLFPASGPP